MKVKDRDNKDILMARREYFATMFSNNKFIEEETNSVDMSHCSKAVMERIVIYGFRKALRNKHCKVLELLNDFKK